MAVEFRQRSLGEFWQMIKRRLWLILLPTIAVGIAVGWVVWKLPDMYESKTSLAIKPATISPDVVKTVTEEELSQSLQAMNQEIQSRSSLEPMIVKYDLFKTEKEAGMPMELIVDKMKKNITVEPEKADNEKWTGFKLTYRDRTPIAAKSVAGDLASKYVNAQAARKVEMGEKTSQFIEEQLNQAKAALDSIEQERLMIMTQNSDALPEGSAGLIAQLTGLRQREETLSKEKDTLVVEKGRTRQSIQSIDSQISMAESLGKKDVDVSVQSTKVEDLPTYGGLIQKRAELSAKYDNLKKVYTDKMPEVIDVKTQIERINDEIEALKKSLQSRDKDVATKGNLTVEKQVASLEIQKKSYENQLTVFDQQMAMKDEESRQNAGNISQIEAKLNQVPGVRIALEGINNRYQMAKSNYDDLSKQLGASKMQVDSTNNAQGESIKIVDFANLPASPVNATKKPLFMALGAGIGLALGLFLAALFEVPRLLKIQSIDDAKHYTGLPVLASVPPLLTHKEKSWQKRSHWLKVFVGIVVAFGSIPAIIILLEKTNVLGKLVS
jgi:polysaccharide biosynthesis transport protein